MSIDEIKRLRQLLNAAEGDLQGKNMGLATAATSELKKQAPVLSALDRLSNGMDRLGNCIDSLRGHLRVVSIAKPTSPENRKDAVPEMRSDLASTIENLIGRISSYEAQIRDIESELEI